MDTVQLCCAVLLVVCIRAEVTRGGEVNKVGTAAATFLRIPVSARAVGMGGAFVSMIDEKAGLYWNPSVLARAQQSSALIDHSPWLPGIDFDFGGLVLPFENIGTIGISATILSTKEMLVTTYDNQMGFYETFTASSVAFTVTFSRSLTDRFAIGGSVKYVKETIYNTSAAGIAFDIGTIFVTPFAGIRLGASITNFGTKMKMEGEDLNVRVDIAPDQEGNNQSVIGRLYTDEYDMPLLMRIGISGELIETDFLRITFALDGINPNDNAQSVNAGGEIGLLGDVLQLRVGMRDLFLKESEFGPSFGIGINKISLLGNVHASLDYAYQKFVHLGYSNRFTVALTF